ncbi:charged multivesicular body protein 2a [Salpingoeca rosetta]|uniref:Charged multivesicular body protein 2a n=1 Tax=Salpingoeca rosetta (strain ATCC 50818 / BSB-021) TaxID=946362 RepID=F2UFN1_SALR5|nr:charged multivesicular body protein 2a [Salpingoeca rosetta]EGD75599.1 charged multivesicular body protein 2a [Salpingoeca rosetta]|eukprot:XP_004992056.1 charged multivesicular body protein 2a [Salpingoeca rosetta]
MEWLFGRKKTPEEMMKENQRLLRRAMRDLDRERQSLERQEKKTMMDIKKAARAGQVDAAKIMAKDVVRTRRFQKKMIMMKTQIQAVSLKIQTLKATNSMAKAMSGVTKAMARMNKTMNIPALQKIMAEFEKQSEVMDMKQEMMDDAVDDVMGEEEDDEERSSTLAPAEHCASRLLITAASALHKRHARAIGEAE